ncbi:YgdI/YgdR family lipoprotein [Pseudomonas matsuisoli]|uniref:Lipoprotein YgdI/YgdR-like SH3-like domain-containing protein n=1 Tax=Pseudomonas matsuisoli TaxID=1515666 RepID=A0A917V0T2_9PSED|nr:YgdI/YgdR family lipoprotein [Pseudomonas matsuisoli]GGK05948.1 hypothetical protein GCM10009304_35010 [Pseudomonas matsuisoli]
MRNLLLATLCALTLAGCASDYFIATTDGRMLNAEGKPQFDETTGMLEFQDNDGRKQQIPMTDVKQVIER